MKIAQLREDYHRHLCEHIIRTTRNRKTNEEYPNFTDGSSRSSIDIGRGIVRRFGHLPKCEALPASTVGNLFEVYTKDFVEKAFTLLHHLRPGVWTYATDLSISSFDQYEHLATLKTVVESDKRLAAALGSDYIIRPDIVIGRRPVADSEINEEGQVVREEESVAVKTPFRQANSMKLILHASISCKWTIRSDRAQNPRTEALNLIRNRKGQVPHMVLVTAEPLPMRIASIALGTGDLDCTYHVALPELVEAIDDVNNQDQKEMLTTLVEGRRLRDISDLPFDLAT